MMLKLLEMSCLSNANSATLYFIIIIVSNIVKNSKMFDSADNSEISPFVINMFYPCPVHVQFQSVPGDNAKVTT